MPFYQYIAVNTQGQEIIGHTEAADEQTAVAGLREQSWLVMDLRPLRRAKREGARQGSGSVRQRRGWVRERDRIHFFRQLALMIRSGLTLLQSLQICARQTPRRRLARCLERVVASIQEGKSLSAAMALEPRQFTTLSVKLIESSEATGELDPVLEQIADLTERRIRLRASLVTSLLYPSIIILVSVAVATFLVLKVIPKFAAFFLKRNLALPATTKALVDLSAWIQDYGLYLCLGLGCCVVAILAASTTSRGRLWMDRTVLRIPVFGRLLTVAAMARLAQTLSSLVKSGVTLLESLRITERVMGNRAVSSKVRDAADRILTGESLTVGMSGPPIPDLVPQVVGVGERSGTLTTVLDDLARFYSDELQASIRRMSAAVEPIMILVVGSMVGFVYIAFFQAVFQLVGR